MATSNGTAHGRQVHGCRTALEVTSQQPLTSLLTADSRAAALKLAFGGQGCKDESQMKHRCNVLRACRVLRITPHAQRPAARGPIPNVHLGASKEP